MTLKKINPEDLVIGQKYLVEIEFRKKTDSKDFPLKFTDDLFGYIVVPIMQPIFTLEQPSTDTELEMLVNVASRLCSSLTAFDFPNNKYAPDMNLYATKALDLITACKNALKEGER